MAGPSDEDKRILRELGEVVMAHPCVPPVRQSSGHSQSARHVRIAGVVVTWRRGYEEHPEVRVAVPPTGDVLYPADEPRAYGMGPPKGADGVELVDVTRDDGPWWDLIAVNAGELAERINDERQRLRDRAATEQQIKLNARQDALARARKALGA